MFFVSSLPVRDNSSAASLCVVVDGLSASNMNLSYGGAVSNMHDTQICDVGSHPSSIAVGCIEKMSFTVHGSGTCWMDILMKLSTKYDKVKGGSEIKDKTESQLLIDLMKSVVDTSNFF